MEKSRFTARAVVGAAAFFSTAFARPSPPLIRVGILTDVPSVTLGPGELWVMERGGRRKIDLTEKVVLGPTSDGRGILTDGKADVENREEGVRVDGAFYGGRLEIRRGGSGITVVNVLPLEDYVSGVLHREISPEWPTEALKAQAVVTRTYALRNKGRHGAGGFDFCSKNHCQVFRGFSTRRSNIHDAVKATRGRVLQYKGRPISAVFHSSCGGSTEESQNVWRSEGWPYLRAVKCLWCRGCPRYVWSAEVDNDFLSRRLESAGFGVGGVSALKILGKTSSGRVRGVRVVGHRGRRDLTANEFRLAAQDRTVRSMFWDSFKEKGNVWFFRGRGWGHGVGLCQWGMKAQAEKGRRYGEILRFYYKGVSLEKAE